jgi:hypothetical protein
VELTNGFRRALSQANSIARGGQCKWTQSRRPWNQWGQPTLCTTGSAESAVAYLTSNSRRAKDLGTRCICVKRSSPMGQAPFPRIQCSRLAPPHDGCSLHEVDPPSRAASDNIYSDPPRFPHIAPIAPQSRQLGYRGRIASRSLPPECGRARCALGWTTRAFLSIPCTHEERSGGLSSSVHCVRR